MGSVSSERVMQKFEVLPESAKGEKRPPRKKRLDKTKLLEISEWTEQDIMAIEEAGKEINKWRVETF